MFLLESASTAWPDILQECLLDPFCQEHIPEKVVFSTVLNNNDDDDFILEDLILLFQEMFGDDDTRGGRYVTTA
jgi:hypothetical protein